MHSLFNGLLMEAVTIQPASLINADYNTSWSGDRIKLADYDGVAVVILKPVGTAGDDLVLDFDQHTAASSGTTKALNVSRIHFNLGGTALTSPAGWVYAEVTPVDTLTLDVLVGGVVKASQSSAFVVGDAIVDMLTDINDSLIVVDVKSSDLDGGGGYPWFSVNSDGNAVGNALIANTLYIPYGAKFGTRVPRSVVA